MGRKSREKRRGTGGKKTRDPLAWIKANIARYEREVKIFADAYHTASRRLEEEKQALVKAGVANTEGLLLPVAPETATAPEAAASEVPTDGQA